VLIPGPDQPPRRSPFHTPTPHHDGGKCQMKIGNFIISIVHKSPIFAAVRLCATYLGHKGWHCVSDSYCVVGLRDDFASKQNPRPARSVNVLAPASTVTLRHYFPDTLSLATARMMNEYSDLQSLGWLCLKIGNQPRDGILRRRETQSVFKVQNRIYNTYQHRRLRNRVLREAQYSRSIFALDEPALGYLS
jgi:hypothetical protein